MKQFDFKRSLLRQCVGMLTAVVLAAPALAKELDTKAIGQDVNIMRGILATAVSGNDERRGPWFGESIEAWYLAEQGVVFRINTSRFREMSPLGHHIEINGEFLDSISESVASAMESLDDLDIEVPEPPEVPEPAVAPAAPGSYSYSFSTGDSGNDLDRKTLRAMAEDIRTKARAVRDKARELERLEDRDQSKDAAAIDAKRKELEKAKNELRTVRDQQTKLITEQKAKQEARWAAQLGDLETKAITALCNYGGSLKSIPRNEHVSLMLTNAVRTGRERQDLMYVFTRQDLADCQAEKLSVAKLREKGLRYTF